MTRYQLLMADRIVRLLERDDLETVAAAIGEALLLSRASGRCLEGDEPCGACEHCHWAGVPWSPAYSPEGWQRRCLREGLRVTASLRVPA